MGCDGLYTPQLPSGWIFQSTHPVWDATITSASERTPHIFQSTHPVWDATADGRESHDSDQISIHASRMGCDTHGVPAVIPDCLFQSTHPVWDATIFILRLSQFFEFQSTHPVWDATIRLHGRRNMSNHFNPRIPYGMRPFRKNCWRLSCNFNPRIPYGMRRVGVDIVARLDISIHASRMGCDG